MDVTEQLDRAIGDGPAHRPVEHRLAAGHRALARRRIMAAAAAACVVAVVGLGYAVAGPGPGHRTDGQVAVDPTVSPSPTGAAEPAWEQGMPVRYLDGELQVRPGVVVHEHIENPFGHREPRRSDALDLTFEGNRMWALLELRDSDTTFSSAAPSNGWGSFADWVADQTAEGSADSGWPDTLRLTDRGTVVASRGSEILQRTDDPQLGPDFAPEGAATGAALVRAGDNDVTYFVVWRVIDDTLDVITVPPRDVVGATFDELLGYARSQYASGEGLR